MAAIIKRIALFIDRLSLVTGSVVAWFIPAMAGVTFLVVLLRYVFSVGWVWMQESVVFMHGIVFLLSAGYTLLKNTHVRVDVFYRPMSTFHKALVDLFGSLCLLLPFCFLILSESLPYVIASWRIQEGSQEAGGLPGVYLLKTAIPLFAVLIGLQGISQAIRSLLVLSGRDSLADGEEHESG